MNFWHKILSISNKAEYFTGADVISVADCTAFAYPDFNGKFLKGKKLAVACPKLDSNKETYVEKVNWI